MDYNEEYETYLDTLSNKDRDKVIYLNNFFSKEKIVSRKRYCI